MRSNSFRTAGWLGLAMPLSACLAASPAVPSGQPDQLSSAADGANLGAADASSSAETASKGNETASASDAAQADSAPFAYASAPCKTCSTDSDCGSDTCVISDGNGGIGQCRPKCASDADCAPGWKCFLHHEAKPNCLPLAGHLQGTANCTAGTGMFLGDCTGTLTGSFVGLQPKFGKGVLNTVTWMGAPSLALQVGMDMGLLGKPTLLFVLPNPLQKKSYAIPNQAPTALFKMGTTDAMAPHFGAGASGSVKVEQLPGSGAVPSQFSFSVDLALYSAPAAMCAAGGVGCDGKDVVMCDTCGTGFEVFACPANQACNAGKCGTGK